MSKMNLKTQAYNTIRQKIVTCEYAPGTFLNEELLTTELGLSRTPVRDALSRLEPVSYTHLAANFSRSSLSNGSVGITSS